MAATTNVGTPLDPPTTDYNPEAVGHVANQQTAQQTNQINTNAGSGGGGVRPTQQTIPQPPAATYPPKPVTATMVPDSPAPIPPPTAPSPVTPTTAPYVAPEVPYNTPVENLIGTKGLVQNPERYRKGNKKWIIQSETQIIPLELPDGTRPILRPLLKANGIIVKVDDFYLVSPQTLADIQNSGNPHYDVAANGIVHGKVMGRTVPIIELDSVAWDEIATRRDGVNRFAGVKGVEYSFRTESEIDGVSKGLLDQINYTLDPDSDRTADGFDVWNLGIKGDYSIEKLNIQTAQEDGKLDKAKLETFLTAIKARLSIMRDDLNTIKYVYYEGKAPGVNNTSERYSKVASTNDPDDEQGGGNYTITTSTIQSVETTPGQATANSAANTASTTAGLSTQVSGLTAAQQVAAQRDTLIASWQSYGFTNEQKGFLKYPPNAGITENVTIGDKTVNIARIWPPDLCTKLRIIGQITNDPATLALLNGYYGTGLNPDEYLELNGKRMAEGLILGMQILEIEAATGLRY